VASTHIQGMMQREEVASIVREVQSTGLRAAWEIWFRLKEEVEAELALPRKPSQGAWTSGLTRSLRPGCQEYRSSTSSQPSTEPLSSHSHSNQSPALRTAPPRHESQDTHTPDDTMTRQTGMLGEGRMKAHDVIHWDTKTKCRWHPHWYEPLEERWGQV